MLGYIALTLGEVRYPWILPKPQALGTTVKMNVNLSSADNGLSLGVGVGMRVSSMERGVQNKGTGAGIGMFKVQLDKNQNKILQIGC